MPDARMTFHVSLEDMERRLSSGENASGVRKFHTQRELHGLNEMKKSIFISSFRYYLVFASIVFAFCF